MKRKRQLVGTLCLVGVLTLSACGAGSTSSSPRQSSGNDGGMSLAQEAPAEYAYDQADYDGGYYDEYEMAVTADEAPESAGGEAGVTVSGTSNSQRKIITTIDIEMESTEYDECAQNIYTAIEAAGGYVEYSDILGNILPVEVQQAVGRDGALIPVPMSIGPQHHYAAEEYGSSSGKRYMFLKIRVPQSGLSSFMAGIEGLGNVLSKQESAEDITLSYVDTQSRINALKTEQERLLEMLEIAETVEDIILLEDRLSYVRYQLESYESQLRVYDNQVSYATVNLRLHEVIIYTEKPIESPTVMQRISKGLENTMTNIGDFWVDTVVWVAVNSVFIVGWAVAIVVVLMVLRRNRKRIQKGWGKLVTAPGGAQGWQPADGEDTPDQEPKKKQ